MGIRRIRDFDNNVRQLVHAGGLLVDMTSNQNAPSTKNGDYDSLMGILTKATTNQIAPSTKKGDSHWKKFVSGHKKLSHDTKS
jgi:hypothetical protein